MTILVSVERYSRSVNPTLRCATITETVFIPMCKQRSLKSTPKIVLVGDLKKHKSQQDHGKTNK